MGVLVRVSFFAVSIGLLGVVFLSGCQSMRADPEEFALSKEHLQAKSHSVEMHSAPIPAINTTAPYLPKPKNTKFQDLYTVSVVQAPIRDVMFKLARDAGIDISISDDVTGFVTVNIIDQTLPVIIDRLNEQTNLRIEIEGKRLLVQTDKPYWVNYPIDYVNLDRYTLSSILLTNAVGSTTQKSTSTNVSLGGPAGQQQATPLQGSGSSVAILNKSQNEVWKTLASGVMRIIRSLYPALAEATPEGQTASASAGQKNSTNASGAQSGTSLGSDGLPVPTTLPMNEQPLMGSSDITRSSGPYPEGAPVSDYINVVREAGFIGVYTTSRAHKEVQKYIDTVVNGSRRQVMIEATVVEVELNDEHQSGINWSNQSLVSNFAGRDQLDYTSSTTGGLITITGSANNPSWSLSSTLKLLERYGSSKVLSSPKMVGINNQPTLLKVVKNLVYFTTTVTPGTTTGTVTTPAVFSTTPNTVPIGLVMSVLPSISDKDEITLVVRPTISSLTGYTEDPNPAFKQASLTTPISSLIPVIQEREMESVLKLNDGQVAVLGGLIQDATSDEDTGIPGLVGQPVVGYLFGQKNKGKRKSELVIFLKPVLIKHPDIEHGDFADKKYMLENRTRIGARDGKE
jgi:general secretion pathway protein D